MQAQQHRTGRAAAAQCRQPRPAAGQFPVEQAAALALAAIMLGLERGALLLGALGLHALHRPLLLVGTQFAHRRP